MVLVFTSSQRWRHRIMSIILVLSRWEYTSIADSKFFRFNHRLTSRKQRRSLYISEILNGDSKNRILTTIFFIYKNNEMVIFFLASFQWFTYFHYCVSFWSIWRIVHRKCRSMIHSWEFIILWSHFLIIDNLIRTGIL